MSLRFQIFLALLVLSLLLAGSLLGFARFDFIPRVQEVEDKSAETDLQRGIEAIYRELYHLERLASAKIRGERLIEYVGGQKASAFIKESFDNLFFSENQIHLVQLVNMKGNALWSRVIDPSSANDMALPSFLSDLVAENPDFIRFENESGVQSGIFLSERGPMLIASAPIYDAHKKRLEGTFIIGRFLTEEVMDTFVGQTRVNLQIWPFFNKTMSAPQQAIVEKLLSGNNFLVVRQGNHRLRAYSVLHDVSGVQPLLIAATVDSPMGELLDRESLFGIGALLSILFILLIAMMVIIQRRIFSPLKRLKKAFWAIADKKEWDRKIGEAGPDEWGDFVQSANSALHALSLRHRQEVRDALDNGRAEMGSKVMRGIRQGLPSVVQELQHLEHEVQHFPVVNFDRLVAEISSCPDTSTQLLALMDRLLNENQHLHELQKYLQIKLGSVKGKTERVMTAARVNTLRFASEQQKKKA